jgi:hypothetical protein
MRVVSQALHVHEQNPVDDSRSMKWWRAYRWQFVRIIWALPLQRSMPSHGSLACERRTQHTQAGAVQACPSEVVST